MPYPQQQPYYYQQPYSPAYYQQRMPSGHRGRTVLATLLLVIGCLLLPVGVASAWLHLAIMDEDGWVATVAPLADEPAVRATVASMLADQLTTGLELETLLGDNLPDELSFITGPISGSVRTMVLRAAEQLMTTDFFRSAWKSAARAIHPSIVALVQGREGALAVDEEGVLVFELGTVGSELLRLIRDAGLKIPLALQPAAETGRISLFHLRYLAEGRAIANVLARLWFVFPGAALLCLLASLLVAHRRFRWLAIMGAALVLSMGLTVIALPLARDAYLTSADSLQLPWETSALFWDVTTRGILIAAFALMALGVVVAATGLIGLATTRAKPRAPQYHVPPAYPGYPPAPPTR